MPKTISQRYIDLNLSFIPNPIRKDISTLSDSDAVKRSILNLVLTKNFERPFHPEIGSNATALLFENATSITALNIKRSIEDVITNFEPRAQLQSVLVHLNTDSNGYDATVTFYVNNVTQLQSVDFFLERLR